MGWNHVEARKTVPEICSGVVGRREASYLHYSLGFEGYSLGSREVIKRSLAGH